MLVLDRVKGSRGWWCDAVEVKARGYFEYAEFMHPYARLMVYDCGHTHLLYGSDKASPCSECSVMQYDMFGSPVQLGAGQRWAIYAHTEASRVIAYNHWINFSPGY